VTSAVPQSVPVLSIAGVRKSYQALRPLRIEALQIAEGERVAIAGIDAGGAEVLVNLVTAAGLPDEGDVRVFGRATSEISQGDEWLSSLERFGIVSPRGVLLESATVEQNLALPFGLEIDPVPPSTASRVAALARECGIPVDDRGWLTRPAADVPPDIRARLHLARAVALDPALLLLEHPTADIPDGARASFADDLVRVAEARRLSTLVITQDERFAIRVAHRVLTLQAATGVLKPRRKGWLR
jgi:ABC-type transporter Mla maintaining outer membrane lipid asymmetry ATPase subunit MlaF